MLLGRLAQSGRALPLQGRSHRFKSCSAHKGFQKSTQQKTTQAQILKKNILILTKNEVIFNKEIRKFHFKYYVKDLQ